MSALKVFSSRFRRDRRESGFSTLELTLTIMIMTMVMGAFYGAYNGFLRDIAFAEQLAEVERRSRPALNELTIELRQATPPNTAANGQPIEVLTENLIVFYSDRASAPGPERIRYEFVNCADQLCELQKTMIFADTGSRYPDFSYDVAGGPDVLTTVIPRIPQNLVMFVGRRLTSAGVVDQPSCDRFDLLGLGAVSCAFSQVVVTLEVVPRAADTSIVPRNFVVIEEVQLRNANF